MLSNLALVLPDEQYSAHYKFSKKRIIQKYNATNTEQKLKTNCLFVRSRAKHIRPALLNEKITKSIKLAMCTISSVDVVLGKEMIRVVSPKYRISCEVVAA